MMTDLETRFRGTRSIPTPDLWPDIVSRQPRPPRAEPKTDRRVLVTIFAITVGLAGIAFAIRAFDASPPPPGSVEPTITNGLIAYASIGDERGFRTIRPDGTDLTVVHVAVPGSVGVPSWAPDGTRIAFDVNTFEDPHSKGGHFDIYTANADGTEPSRLTFEKVDHGPVWSPDGTAIAYVHGTGNDQQIWVMEPDGSDPHRLTDRPGLNLLPSWSPDGSRIALVSFDDSNSDIYVMAADGSGVRRLTDDPSHEDRPAWSPDGRLIAFTREGSGDPGIYAMAPDGSDVTQLLHDPDPANLGFAWAPDGSQIAVVSIRGPGFDRRVYLLDVGTGELTAIGEPGAFFGPSWQPLPVSLPPSGP
jgi:Tol biopolymer transport system component